MRNATREEAFRKGEAKVESETFLKWRIGVYLVVVLKLNMEQVSKMREEEIGEVDWKDISVLTEVVFIRM